MSESPEERLRRIVREMSILELEEYESSERMWREHVNTLRQDILEKDPRKMLEFWVIRHTMYTVWHPEWTQMQLEFLHSRPDWKDRWFEAVRDPMVGSPLLLNDPPHTSRTILLHAYVLAQFEARTGMQVDELPIIFEFGGGYGAMAHLIYNLGFAGQYLDYDFPIFAALTEYYLSQTGPHQATCLSSLDDLETALAGIDTSNALFLSTWALSETPLELRKKILTLVHDFRYFLVTYQPRFCEVDNCNFFAKWQGEVDGVDWQTWDIENVGSYGLIGVRRDD